MKIFFLGFSTALMLVGLSALAESPTQQVENLEVILKEHEEYYQKVQEDIARQEQKIDRLRESRYQKKELRDRYLEEIEEVRRLTSPEHYEEIIEDLAEDNVRKLIDNAPDLIKPNPLAQVEAGIAAAEMVDNLKEINYAKWGIVNSDEDFARLTKEARDKVLDIDQDLEKSSEKLLDLKNELIILEQAVLPGANQIISDAANALNKADHLVQQCDSWRSDRVEGSVSKSIGPEFCVRYSKTRICDHNGENCRDERGPCVEYCNNIKFTIELICKQSKPNRACSKCPPQYEYETRRSCLSID